MIIKIRIAHWRFTFTIAPVTNVIGVNSNLPDGNHIIMWDFDDVKIEHIAIALRVAQKHFQLPNIYLLTTGKPDHFIAYCFKKVSWIESMKIVISTPDVDQNFIKYGVYREHWTLRVTPKEGRKPQLITILKSNTPETTNINELASWVKDAKKTSISSITSHACIEGAHNPDSSLLSRQRKAPAQNMKH